MHLPTDSVRISYRRQQRMTTTACDGVAIRATTCTDETKRSDVMLGMCAMSTAMGRSILPARELLSAGK